MNVETNPQALFPEKSRALQLNLFAFRSNKVEIKKKRETIFYLAKY